MPHNKAIQDAINLHQLLSLGNVITGADVEIALRVVHASLIQGHTVNMATQSGVDAAAKNMSPKLELTIPYSHVLLAIQAWLDAGVFKPGYAGASPAGQPELLELLHQTVRISKNLRLSKEEFRFFVRINNNSAKSEEIVFGNVPVGSIVMSKSSTDVSQIADFIDRLKKI